MSDRTACAMAMLRALSEPKPLVTHTFHDGRTATVHLSAEAQRLLEEFLCAHREGSDDYAIARALGIGIEELALFAATEFLFAVEDDPIELGASEMSRGIAVAKICGTLHRLNEHPDGLDAFNVPEEMRDDVLTVLYRLLEPTH